MNQDVSGTVLTHSKANVRHVPKAPAQGCDGGMTKDAEPAVTLDSQQEAITDPTADGAGGAKILPSLTAVTVWQALNTEEADDPGHREQTTADVIEA